MSILFPRSSFTQTTCSSTFFCRWMSQVFSNFNRVTQILNLTNRSKTCVLHTVRSPKATANISSFCIFYLQFRAKFDVHTLYFQVCHLLGIPKWQLEQHMLIFKKTLLRNHISYILTASWKWLSRLLHLCLVVEVCASSSSVIFW